MKIERKKDEDRQMDQKRQQTKKRRQTHKKKKRQTDKKRTVERDHRGIIFASLYTIIENKMGDIFLTGQNQCHITGVKKSYFCHTFHLRPKKVFWWVVGGGEK